MRYVVLIYHDEAVWPTLDAAARETYVRAHVAFDRAVRERGTIEASESLVDTAAARTLRHDGDRTVVTDGPFAETTEQLGGFYVVDLGDDDLDAVLRVAAELPRAYSVEVRAVRDMTPVFDEVPGAWDEPA